ncbi:hypothetical protein GCM10020001_071290 [Nonomuraea salmonea]
MTDLCSAEAVGCRKVREEAGLLLAEAVRWRKVAQPESWLEGDAGDSAAVRDRPGCENAVVRVGRLTVRVGFASRGTGIPQGAAFRVRPHRGGWRSRKAASRGLAFV